MKKKSPLQRVEELIPVLPGKDAELSMKFLKERDFESILAIVKSDLYKANKARFGRLEDVPDDYITALTELKGELMTYMSYLEIPEDQEDEDYYY